MAVAANLAPGLCTGAACIIFIVDCTVTLENMQVITLVPAHHRTNGCSKNRLLIDSVYSPVALRVIHKHCRLHVSLQVDMQCVWVEWGQGHRCLHVSSGRGEAQACVCWICLWLWHESTNPPTRAGPGIIKTFELNKYFVQQRAA